jgi:hypothetical protein
MLSAEKESAQENLFSQTKRSLLGSLHKTTSGQKTCEKECMNGLGPLGPEKDYAYP